MTPTDSSEKFRIADYNVDDFFGSMGIPVGVVGYWSESPISIRVFCRYGDDDLEIDILHSSGGRDQKEEPSEMEAAKNFGLAMLQAAAVGEEIMENKAAWKAARNANLERHRIKREEEQLARKEEINSDTIIGTEGAHAIALTIRAKAKETNQCVYRSFRDRGTTNTFSISCDCNSSNVSFYYGHTKRLRNRISIKEAILKISKSAEQFIDV